MKSTAIALTILLLGCGSGSDFNLVSIEEEWQLGQQLSKDIENQLRLSRDPEINEYVQRMGRRMVAATPMANLPWEFHVVENAEINAFAIPGGHVYVHTGLIAAADNASELAGVMAHEISHGVARHSTEQLSRHYGISVLAGIALGKDPAAYQQILAQILAGGTLARFSREAENEADRLGVQTMQAAGYDPRGMATMFQELLENRRGRPGAVEKFFSTHPLTEDRIRNVEAQIRATPPPSGLTTDEPQFQSVKQRVQ